MMVVMMMSVLLIFVIVVIVMMSVPVFLIFILVILMVFVRFVMMVMLLFPILFIIFVIVMMMVVMVLLLVMMVVSRFVRLLFLLFGHFAFQLTNPSGGGGHFVIVEEVGIYQVRDVHVGVVAGDNLRTWLQHPYDVLDAVQLLGLHLRSLVEQDEVTELYLLDDEVLDVLIVNLLFRQAVATGELALQAQAVHHRADTVEARHAVLRILSAHAPHRADGARDRFRLADAAGLYHDVVEPLHLLYLVELLYQVHLQRAADASVLQRHQAVVLLAHDAAFLNQVRVDVHLADIVHDDGELNAPLVG